MSVTTRRAPRRSKQERAERRDAFRALAMQFEKELQSEGEEGKHHQALAKVERDASLKGLQRYSPLNQIMILSQCPNATEVAGYVEWKSRGKQVKGGEAGIAIRAPRTARDQEEGGEKVIGFGIAYVWDISQVEDLTTEAPEPETAATTEDE